MQRLSGHTILLVSGEYFNLLEPETSNFTVEDIAHGLSNLCRYTGQISSYYSVAEHSVLCSEHVAPEHALAALLHDASEAFIGDVSRPLKALLPEYKTIEQRIERAVCARFELPFPMHPAIKEIDNRMLVTEQHQRMNNHDDWSLWTEGVEALPITLECWLPNVAKGMFLRRYRELTGR